MQQTIQHAAFHPSTLTNKTKTSSPGFIVWCEKQQPKSLFWLAIIMLTQTCVLLPIVWFTLSHSDMGFIFWVLPSIAIVMCLVTNLATLPTRITIPVFILSIVIDLVVIAAAFYKLVS